MLYVLGYLALSTAVMAFALYWSAKKTLYSYANIVLIGGLLFNSVFLIVCTRFLLTIPLDTAVDFTYFYESLLAFPRTFSYYAFFVILFICVLLGISNVELIRHEGFRLHNALSLLVAGLYGGGTMAVYLIADKLYESIFVPLGLSTNPVFIVLSTVIPLFLLLVLCYFECILAGTGILGWIAARAVPAYDKDYIIILGCSIDKRGGLLPLLRGRVNRAVRFAWEQEIATGKALRYVPSGGQGPNEIMSEGSAMGFYLMTHGAEEYEVIPEKQSRNTWENFCFSKKLIEEMPPPSQGRLRHHELSHPPQRNSGKQGRTGCPGHCRGYQMVLLAQRFCAGILRDSGNGEESASPCRSSHCRSVRGRWLRGIFGVHCINPEDIQRCLY